ncbi:MAG: sulfotransferase domain-containing protein [Bacteroidota bacterium]|nr:sulfotransferase domain-containing protein [Bacteroidota bacterium]
MLIVCNGIFKSGSSWLHAIILEILRINKIKLSEVPIIYTNNVNSPTTIIESKLAKFLEEEDYINRHYITKSHYYLKKTIAKSYDLNVHFLFVERDVRDAIVSHYHHLKKKYVSILGFRMYYFFIGRLKAFEIVNFNRRYKKAFGEDNFFKYSEMKNDFESIVLKVATILNLKRLSKEEILIIKNNTSIGKMRSDLVAGKLKYYSTVSKDREDLIRKGMVGDWVNYFSKRQAKDIKKIEAFRVSFILRVVYLIVFTLRRRLFRIE